MHADSLGRGREVRGRTASSMSRFSLSSATMSAPGASSSNARLSGANSVNSAAGSASAFVSSAAATREERMLKLGLPTAVAATDEQLASLTARNHCR